MSPMPAGHVANRLCKRRSGAVGIGLTHSYELSFEF